MHLVGKYFSGPFEEVNFTLTHVITILLALIDRLGFLYLTTIRFEKDFNSNKWIFI